MPLAPAFDEQDPLSARVFRNPKKHLADLLRGMGRGTASMPGDIADLLSMSVPGGKSAGAGDLSRALLDETDTFKATGAPLESAGEITAPAPPVGKLGMLGSILVGGKRAMKGGLIKPEQLLDALRMFKGGRSNPDILSQTGIYASNPRVFDDKPILQALIETPGAKVGDAQLFPDVATLADRLKSGDVQGFDDVVKLYPELSSMLLKKIDNPSSSAAGSFDPARKELMLNYAHKGVAPPTEVLGHEIGHVIQGADKIPGGANPGYVASRIERIAPVAQHRADVLSSALLGRRLADKSGASARPVIGHSGLADVQNAWASNRSATKGAFPMTDEVRMMAASRSADDIEGTLDRVMRLNEKVPANPFDGYLKTGGETWSRIIEKLLGMSVDDAKKLGDLHKLDPHGVRPEQIFDINELSIRALQGAGAYKPFR